LPRKTEPWIIIWMVLTVYLVMAFSAISVKAWKEPRGGMRQLGQVSWEPETTAADLARKRSLPPAVVINALGLASEDQMTRRVSEFGLTEGELLARINKSLAFYIEQETKNWTKIYLKFALWIVFLLIPLRLMMKRTINAHIKPWLYGAAVLIFGVVLGADPSPMGTVKDALVLYGRTGAVFPPRVFALGVFLVLTVLANKFICSWGCQFGALQDFIFRLNRRKADRKGVMNQRKPAFVLTNSIRAAVFAAMAGAALLFSFDLVGRVNPFRIFKPHLLGTVGGVFLGGILLASLFMYRPWCHLFCPFGFLGWIFEKISLLRIRVNYETCIACCSCAKACPSTVMEAILTRERRTIPDCFSCGVCIHTCPTDSISFSFGRRRKPPAGHFGPPKTKALEELSQ